MPGFTNDLVIVWCLKMRFIFILSLFIAAVLLRSTGKRSGFQDIVSGYSAAIESSKSIASMLSQKNKPLVYPNLDFL